MIIRYFPRYAGKEGFEERYEVVDSRTGEVLSPRGPYNEILEQVEARNNPVETAELPVVAWQPWCGNILVGDVFDIKDDVVVVARPITPWPDLVDVHTLNQPMKKP